MAAVTTEEIMQKAEELCCRSGVKLTEKRKRVLSVLVDSDGAMSAYEIADYIAKVFDTSVPPMSVYRMLDFLVSVNLVHKLHSENKFIACSHITCCESHQVPQFLICDGCRKVTEIGIPQEIMSALADNVGKAGFRLLRSQLELPCLCETCAAKKAKTSV